jgi:hypothetical protein
MVYPYLANQIGASNVNAIAVNERTDKRYGDLLAAITEAQQRLSSISDQLSAITKLVEADQLLNKYSSLVHDEVLRISVDVPELSCWINQNIGGEVNENENQFKGINDDAVQSIVERQGEKGITPHFIAKMANNEGRNIVDSSARKSLSRLKSRGLVIDRDGRWFSVPTR